jgi:hypothetical protein
MSNHHEPPADAALLAEQAGAYEMDVALTAMRAAGSQAERFSILSDQLVALVTDGNPHAAAGAATMLVNWIERGMGIDT